MATVRSKYYWDACVWIELITQSDNGDRFKRCSHIFSKAQKGEVELWTSTFTLTEVYKRKCNSDFKTLPKSKDDKFEAFFKSGLVKPILLDIQVAQVARRLCREHLALRKPQDAVHIASCIVYNVGELHTFDQKDLIKLNEQIPLENGKFLKITKPPTPPPGLQFEILN